MSGTSKSKSSKGKLKNNNGQIAQNGGHVVVNPQVNQGGLLDMTSTSSGRDRRRAGHVTRSKYVSTPLYDPVSQSASVSIWESPKHAKHWRYANMQGQSAGLHVGQHTQTSVQYDQSGIQQNPLVNNNTYFDSNTIVTMIQQMNNNFMGRLSSIETSVSKLSSIEYEISHMRSDLSKLQLDNATISRRITEVERSCQMISNMYDDASKSNSEIHNNVSQLQTDHSSLNSKVEENVSRFQDRCDTLKDELLELKARSMQSNLVFYGLAEAPKGESDNTESKLKDFLSHELDLEDPNIVDSIVFDRVHRLGRPRHDQNVNPRPIVAKFERYRERELIKEAGRTLNDKDVGYKIREQFPPEIEARRKLLYPVMRSYQRDPKNRVALVRDKLYINNKLYQPPATSDSGVFQNRQQNTAYPGHNTQNGRNRRFVRGVRLSERPPIETHNPFEPLRIDDDDSHGIRDKSSTVIKRPATSPAYEDREPKKHMFQESSFGTINEHVESELQFPDMEAETIDTITDDSQITPREIDTEVQRDSGRQITVNAEIHRDDYGSHLTGHSDTSEITADNTDASK